MELYLSRAHFPVTTLGPGRRLGIWFQGCGIHCPGCISADTWRKGRRGQGIPVAQFLADIQPWLLEADGLTISGGEPFGQPEALRELLLGVRRQSRGDILAYSGYPLEQLDLSRFTGLIDALVSDPYDETAPQTLVLRGSDNQRLTLLSALGRERFAALARKRRDDPDDSKALDVMFDADGGIWMAGIPRRDDLSRLREILRQQGHEAPLTNTLAPAGRARESGGGGDDSALQRPARPAKIANNF
jgi:anaerobic ribonucleoside-triphosphate reductase activating protein